MRGRRASLLVVSVVVLGAAGCDHATKQLAISALSESHGVSLAGDTLRLQLASNPGAFLSLGAELPAWLRSLLFLALGPLAALALCVFLLLRGEASVPAWIGLGLFAGGGLGNWLDRLLHDGAVTDFLVLRVGPLHTGVFNVADVAVLAGIGLLLWTRRHGAPEA